MFKNYRIAVLIPCYNEEATVRDVVRGFQNELPGAAVYVYDNNSQDATADRAREAGARVVPALYQGKGNVVRKMFAEVEADIYVLVDGDSTYDAPSCVAMIRALVDGNLDMVVGCRAHMEASAYRPGHVLGNRALTGTVKYIFGKSISDLLSGYRVFSRRYVKSFPCQSRGFEIETEMSVHALHMRLPISEVETPYYSRPEDSPSKLSTYKDGWKILCTIMGLFMYEKPRQFCGIISAVLLFTAVLLAVPLLATWLSTGLVPRLPTAVLCSGMVLLAFFLMIFGLLLDSVQRNKSAMLHFAYLRQNGVRSPGHGA